MCVTHSHVGASCLARIDPQALRTSLPAWWGGQCSHLGERAQAGAARNRGELWGFGRRKGSSHVHILLCMAQPPPASRLARSRWPADTPLAGCPVVTKHPGQRVLPVSALGSREPGSPRLCPRPARCSETSPSAKTGREPSVCRNACQTGRTFCTAVCRSLMLRQWPSYRAFLSFSPFPLLLPAIDLEILRRNRSRESHTARDQKSQPPVARASGL